MSVEFYNKNAEDFYKGTVDADMSDTYKIFESFMDSNSAVLDLGCGSGRDSKYFLDNGYQVTSVDYSEEMVKKSSILTGQKTLHMDMTKMVFEDKFHAIWACASILHIPKPLIPKVLTNCYNSLREDGILYMSFKYGDGEVQKNKRSFSNFTETSFSELLSELNLFTVKRYWKTSDVRPGRENEFWLNILLQK